MGYNNVTALHGLMSQSAGSLESTINKAKSVKHRGKLDADIDDAQRRLQVQLI